MAAAFEYQFTEAEMARGWALAQRRWRKLDWLTRLFGVLNAALAILGALLLEPRNPGAWVLLLPAAYLLGMPWYRSMLFRRRLRDLPGFGGRVRWILGKSSIEVSGGGGDQTLDWAAVENAEEGEEGLILRLDTRSFLWLPWDGLVEGTPGEVRETLRARMGSNPVEG